MKVFVTDAQQRIALHVIQYLGRAGIHVVALEYKTPIRISICGFLSKYAKEKYYSPNPEKEGEKFIRFINSFAKNEKFVLFAIKNRTIKLLAKNKHRLSKNIIFPFAEYKTLKKAFDKKVLLEKAAECGIKVPKTYIIRSLKELPLISEKLLYPVVIKLREEKNVFQERRYKIVYSTKALENSYREMHNTIQKYPLIQEYIKGGGIGFNSIINKDHKPIAIFMHKRLREYPLSGGPSTLCQGIFDPRIKKSGINLLNQLGWYGVAMVEFKVDKEGIPWLMEVNPRFWGSFPLAVESGVNFPLILYKLAVGEKSKPVIDYSRGIKLRYIFSDLKAMEEHLLTRKGKLKFLIKFVKDLRNKKIREGNFSKDDPLPTLPFFLEYLKHLARGLSALPKVVVKT